MLAEIVNAYVEMSKHTPVVAKYTCKYCNKSFVRESTLSSHLCELKRRYQQEKEQGVQFGYNAYAKFYEFTQPGIKPKTYDDFARSDFYLAFVKYGRYQVSIKTVNFISFTQWLLKNNKKLDHWTKEEFYVEWLKSYIQKESVDDALDRSFQVMQEYADSDPETLPVFIDYFRNVSKNRIVNHIQGGRISPWIVYNCSSGVDFLDSLNDEQINYVMPYIDPDFWQMKFSTNKKDVDWLKNVLKEAGL